MAAQRGSAGLDRQRLIGSIGCRLFSIGHLKESRIAIESLASPWLGSLPDFDGTAGMGWMRPDWPLNTL
jgi:hypothetical protein